MRSVESNPEVKSVVLATAKPGCWIAGADIKYSTSTYIYFLSVHFLAFATYNLKTT